MSQQDDVFINTFRALLIVLAGLAVIFFIVAHYLDTRFNDNSLEQGPQARAQLEARLRPMGRVHVAGEAPPAAATPAPAAKPAVLTGKQVYERVCSGCHASGALGAPVFGNKASWAPHIAKGIDVLYQHALHGFKKMPARGGSKLPDQDIKNGVQYMVSHSK